MVQEHPELIPVCHDKKIDSGHPYLSNSDIARALLSLFFEVTPRQFVVIDGLDECEPPEVRLVLQFFVGAVEKCDGYNPGKLRVLFSSWFLSDMKKYLGNASIMEIQERDNAADIESFVKQEVKSLAQYNLEPQVYSDIIDMTCRGAQGKPTSVHALRAVI